MRDLEVSRGLIKSVDMTLFSLSSDKRQFVSTLAKIVDVFVDYASSSDNRERSREFNFTVHVIINSAAISISLYISEISNVSGRVLRAGTGDFVGVVRRSSSEASISEVTPVVDMESV